jgi:four helix bundle protein
MLKNYQELLVWQKAHSLVLDIYKISSRFPQEEQFGIVQQIRRAAYSVPANIAEGFERSYTKEFIRFITVAKGSLSETKYFLILSRDLGYIEQEVYFELEKDFDEIGKMLNGLINSLRKKT